MSKTLPVYRQPKFWIGVLSIVGVVLISVQYSGRTSPGPVTAAHAALPELAGGQSCSACHGGWMSTMTESCAECHEEIVGDIDAGLGVHGKIDETLVVQCARCHSDHHGADFKIVNRSSFALAGTVGPDEFDHNFIGFAMAGKHMDLECSECHKSVEAKVLSEGQHRYRGLVQNCATCHTDPHEGRMSVGCASCHGQESFEQLHSTGHDRFLPLTGGHEDVSCRACHPAGTSHALEVVGVQGRGGGPRGSRSRGCAECHASPHDASFATGVASAAGVDPEGSCAQCHLEDHKTFQDDSVTVTVAQHAHSGFELAKPHEKLDCAKCHEPETSDGADIGYAERYPGRHADDCRACHEDPHGGQFAGGSYATAIARDLGMAAGTPEDEVSCLLCHARTHFDPVAFGVEEHAKTNFALTGRHARVDCHVCHLDPEPGELEVAVREFSGTPTRCQDCHTDSHHGFFAALPSAPLAEVALPDAGSCAHCHKAGETFGDLIMPFDHERWTAFPIQGAHAQSDCTSCHPRTDEPDRTGRTFGRVHEHYGQDYQGCQTCHGDPHRGQFDLEGLPAQVGGRDGCARCHNETSFRRLVSDFDHELWTGFGLLGKHAKADCSSCHAPLRRPDAEGRTWARALGRDCADCHLDPHQGQFVRRHRGATRTNCVECHKSYSVFEDLAFDHERQSRFKLGEAHANLDCAACHKPEQLGDALVTRYRPIPMQCVDCHGTTEDPLRRRDRRR